MQVPRGKVRPAPKRRLALVGRDLEVTPDESEARTAARLERSRAYQQIWKKRLKVTGVMVGLAVLFLFSLVTISLPGSTAESKEVAKQALPALATGLLSYFVGRRSGN